LGVKRRHNGVEQVIQMTAAPSTFPADEAGLLARARAGEGEAFGKLIQRYQRRIWLVCRQYIGPDDADAAAQDTFIKAYTKLNSFDSRARFSTWLTRIAINHCLDLLRKKSRIPLSGEEPEGETLRDFSPNPEELSRRRQAVRQIMKTLDKLPEGQKRIFRLRFLAEMDLQEIASTLEVHPGTVKTQLHRAIHRLRREMEVLS